MAASAVTAALAFAVPAANANAATPIVDPTVCSLLNGLTGPFGPTSAPGGASLGDVLNRVGMSVGCSAPSAPSFPTFPGLPTFPWSH
jgi:hypothetical protein